MKKYKAIEPIAIENRTWPDKEIQVSPTWCAVDLRDGNQALPNPLTMEQKKIYFKTLVEIGFKEIEVGFPSASQDDWDFCRWLIDGKNIPDDVMISVLAPSRPDLIRKTVHALAGSKQATLHFYVATSDLHRVHVLGKSQEDTLKMVADSIDAIKDEIKQFPDTRYFLEFSPEEFTDTDLDFSIAVCDFVVERWAPEAGEKVILNLPATVERRPPTHYADMIELFRRKMKSADESVSISLHAHNDMGCAVASTQLAIQAGADRVEGTLFGQGERSGNVDLITLGLNLQYLGVETGLDFSNLSEINDRISALTGMTPHERHPYVGSLVFSAFSGSHQDAIHKCLLKKQELYDVFDRWKIPYLHVDPADLGREFEKLIRINSQSGKGGIAHVIKMELGIDLPRHIQIDFAKRVQGFAEEVSREVSGQEICQIFNEAYVLPVKHAVELINYWPYPDENSPEIINAKLEVKVAGEPKTFTSRDNGPLSAFVAALKQADSVPNFSLESYEEDAVGGSARADAVAYVTLASQGKQVYGIGTHANINQAAVEAILAGVNKLIAGID